MEDISSGSWYSWDISADVREAFHDDKTLSEALIWGNTTEYGRTSFGSRESGWPPKLEIAYTIPTSPAPTPSVTPTTPTPPPTPTPWWEEPLWWIIIGTVGTIVLVFLTYEIYRLTKRDRRKP